MSRIRTVKPELFKHEDLFDAEQNSQLPLRLAFVGLFTVADREGRFKWRPRTLKLDVLPHDFIDFAAVLDALAHAGFIESYEVDGEKYGWIPTFTKHQRFTGKEAEAKSLLPPPPQQQDAGKHWGNNGEALGKHPDVSPLLHGETMGKQRGTQEWNKERNREWNKERNGETAPSAPAPEALSAKAAKASKPTQPLHAPLPDDWTPAETTYALLAKHGIPQPFAESCLDEFRLYWQERGESRPGWEATFVNNVKHQWERRPATATPGNGQRYAPPPPTRAMTPEAAEFDAILRNLNRQNLQPVIEGECRHVAH